MDGPFRLTRMLGGRGSAAAQAIDAGASETRTAADAAAANFDRLYAAAFPKVYAFIRSQVATAETAQDLVSRIFLKAYAHRLKAPADSAGISWLFRIARNTLIDYWRVDRKRERASVGLDELADRSDEGLDAEAAYERRERSAHLLRVMGELSEEDRTVLALKFTAQRTNRDIAVVLNISEAAVSMRLLRALRGLRARLQGTGWE